MAIFVRLVAFQCFNGWNGCQWWDEGSCWLCFTRGSVQCGSALAGNSQALPHHPGYSLEWDLQRQCYCLWRVHQTGGVAATLFSSQPAGSRRVCTILDLHSEATSHWATWPWCPCPQVSLELDYLEGAFQLTPFQPSDSVPYRCPAKLVLCLGTPDLVVLHLKLHLHLVRLQHLLRVALAVCRKPQMKSSSHCPPVNSWSSVV